MAERDPTVELIQDYRALIGLMRDDFHRIAQAQTLDEAKAIAREALAKRLANGTRRRKRN